MNAILIGGIIAAVVILGAWLRWSVRSTVTAFRLGVDMGRMLQAQEKGDAPSPPWHEVAFAWLMPWRAARTIREQRGNIQLLIRTLAHNLRPDCECGHWETGHDEAASGSRKCGYENCLCPEYLPVPTREPAVLAGSSK